MQELSYRTAIVTSINLFKNNIKFLAGFSLIYTILLISLTTGKLNAVDLMPANAIISQGIELISNGSPDAHNFINSIINIIVIVVILLSAIRVSIDICDGKKLTFSELIKESSLLKEYKHLVGYLEASFIFFVLYLLGLILLFVPGIYFAMRSSFYAYLIVDKNMGPLDSLKKSFELTKGKTRWLFGYTFIYSIIVLIMSSIIILIITYIGFIALGDSLSVNLLSHINTFLSVFIALPLQIGIAFVYRSTIKKQEEQNVMNAT
jgi:uncharacterized membrane protein